MLWFEQTIGSTAALAPSVRPWGQRLRRIHGGADRKSGRTDPRLPADRAPGRRRLRRSLEVRGARRTATRPSSSSSATSSAAGDDGHRAEQELKALSRVKTVRHPYILSLERYDIIDGQLIIVMELADRNLWDRFKECRAQGLPGIPREELLGYMEETAEALDLMNNEYQLQHLDIKPQNLFLVHNHIKVADFGLVKDLEGMQASVTGGVTPVYAAPETFDGWVSRFCDQYSLAIVYQELLTGQRPFTGTNVRQLILQHLQAAPNVEPLPPARPTGHCPRPVEDARRPLPHLPRSGRGAEEERRSDTGVAPLEHRRDRRRHHNGADCAVADHRRAAVASAPRDVSLGPRRDSARRRHHDDGEPPSGCAAPTPTPAPRNPCAVWTARPSNRAASRVKRRRRSTATAFPAARPGHRPGPARPDRRAASARALARALRQHGSPAASASDGAGHRSGNGPLRHARPRRRPSVRKPTCCWPRSIDPAIT